jgi:hypothetical protein
VNWAACVSKTRRRAETSLLIFDDSLITDLRRFLLARKWIECHGLPPHREAEFYLPNPFHENSYRPPLRCSIHNLFFSSSTTHVEFYFSDDEARWLEDKYFIMCDIKTKNRKNKEAAEKRKILNNNTKRE